MLIIIKLQKQYLGEDYLSFLPYFREKNMIENFFDKESHIKYVGWEVRRGEGAENFCGGNEIF